MRYSSELGYYAPISVMDRKNYRYDNNDYSITDVPQRGDKNPQSETIHPISRNFPVMFPITSELL